MNSSLLHIEAARWNKLGRRWSIILGALLTVNLSLVVVAVRGYTLNQVQATEQTAQHQAVETIDDCLVNDAPVVTPSASTSGEPVGAQPKPVTASEPSHTLEPTDVEPSVEASPAPIAIEGTPAPAPEPAVEPLVVKSNPALVIVNPRLTGGSVHFLVDDVVVSLESGEYHLLEGDALRRIVFHAGDAFEDVELTLTTGVFMFEVSTEGWQLTESCDDVDTALKSCRAAAAL